MQEKGRAKSAYGHGGAHRKGAKGANKRVGIPPTTAAAFAAARGRTSGAANPAGARWWTRRHRPRTIPNYPLAVLVRARVRATALPVPVLGRGHLPLMSWPWCAGCHATRYTPGRPKASGVPSAPTWSCSTCRRLRPVAGQQHHPRHPPPAMAQAAVAVGTGVRPGLQHDHHPRVQPAIGILAELHLARCPRTFTCVKPSA